MKKIKKVLPLLLSACMFVSSIPQVAHAKEASSHYTEHNEEKSYNITTSAPHIDTRNAMVKASNNSMDVVYTKFVVDSSGSSGGTENGTAEKPYTSFQDAYDKVKEGGTIYIIDNTSINSSESADGESMPYIMNKSVTIEGSNGSLASLSTRTGGIILGADVTFKNIEFGLANPARNAIFANGHRLELINCGMESGGRKVNVFAGGAEGSSAVVGEKSEVIIDGSCSSYDSIYGGSMHTGQSVVNSFDKEVSISLLNLERQEISGIYASGAQIGIFNPNNWFDFEAPQTPVADSSAYPNTGKVSIHIDNSSIYTVYGDAAGNGFTVSNKADVSINTGNDNPYLGLTLVEVGNFTINGGLVGISTVPDTITIGSNGTLLMDSLMEYNFAEINNLHGEEGSRLRMGIDEQLIINGDFTGTVEFRTDSYQYENPNGSGLITPNHIYIDGSAEHTGVFTYVPHPDDSDMELVNKDGKWTVKAKGSSDGTETEDTLVATFEFITDSISIEKDELKGGEFKQIDFSFVTNGMGDKEPSDIPIQYEIEFKNRTYTGVENEDGFYEFADLNLILYLWEFYGDAFLDIDSMEDTDLTSGVYAITVRVEAQYSETGEELSDVFTLTVNGDEQEQGVPAPANFRVTKRTPYTITLEWDAVTGIDGSVYYYLSRDGGKTHMSDSLEADTSSTSYTFGNLTPNKTYTFKLRTTAGSEYSEYVTISATTQSEEEHTHVPVNHTWYSTNTDHYHLCECGQSVNAGKHVFLEWINSGSMHNKICSICYKGYDMAYHTLAEDVADWSYKEGDSDYHYKLCECGLELAQESHEVAEDLIDWTIKEENATQHYKLCKCGFELVSEQHNFVDGKDITHHWEECSKCGAKQNIEPHQAESDLQWEPVAESGTHAKICSCGHLVASQSCDYTTGEYEISPTQHKAKCACGNVESVVEGKDYSHTFEEKKDTTHHWQECSVCEYEKDKAAHEMIDGEYESDETKHWRTCICGEILGEEEHAPKDGAWDKDEIKHWGTCICGEILDEKEHTPKDNTLYKDETHHWKECECGEELNKTVHASKDDTLYKDGIHHWKECECGEELNKTAHATQNDTLYKDRTHHWKECVCGEELNKTTHAPKDDAWDKDETKHWKKCICGEILGEEEHTSKDDTLYKNETHHWKECVCGEELNKTTHAPKDDTLYKDENHHWKECVCGKEQDKETHNPVDESWETTETMHWQECSCGRILNEGAHIPKDDTWYEDNNMKYQLCVCGKILNDTGLKSAALQEALAKKDLYEREKYTTSTYRIFEEAIRQGEEAFQGSDLEEQKLKAQAIEEAIKNLKERATAQEAQKVLEEITALKEETFTEESFGKVLEGKEKLTAALGNLSEVSKEEMERLVAEVRKSIQELEKVQEDSKEVPEGIWIQNFNDKLVYNGTKQTQEILVYDGETLLRESKDYTLTYKNNLNAYELSDTQYHVVALSMGSDDGLILNGSGTKIETGTSVNAKDKAKAPQIILKMKGNYKGTYTIYFEIAPCSMEQVQAGDLAVTYNGKNQTPNPEVIWEGKKLKINRDFEVKEYREDKENKTTSFVGKKEETQKKVLTLCGKGNFEGNKEIFLTIGKLAGEDGVQEISMSKVTVSGIKDLSFDKNCAKAEGMKQENYTVKYKKAQLKDEAVSPETGEFSVSYENNHKVGTATMILEGTGKDNDGDGIAYIGTKRITFKIKGTSMSQVKVEGLKKGYTYTGTEIQPLATDSDVRVTLKKEKVDQEAYTVEYQKNIQVGTATILLTGVEEEGYSGVKKQTFSIVADTLTDNATDEKERFFVKIIDAAAEDILGETVKMPYTKGGAKPAVEVTDPKGKVLMEGTDYTVKYQKNTSVGARGTKVIVTGKGNYKGSVSVPFEIIAKDLSKEVNQDDVTMVIKDLQVSSKKNGWKSALKLADQDGKALTAKDVDIKAAEYRLVSLPETMEEIYNREELEMLLNAGTDLNTTDKLQLPAGSKVQVTVAMKEQGSYRGTVTGTYRILEKGYDISKAKITILPQEYTGKAVEILKNSDFTKAELKIGKTTETLRIAAEEGKEANVEVIGYEKNIQKGTAKVILKGKEGTKFGGTKTVTFKIIPREVESNFKGFFE